MGTYVNPNNSAFQVALNSEIYIDKTELLSYTNKVLGSKEGLICNSRPRRFGKSITADMLVAYYSKGCDSKKMFEDCIISKKDSFQQHLNKYNVIRIDVQWCYTTARLAETTVSYIEENGEIIQKFETKYGDFLQNSKEEFLINEEEKKAHKEKMLFKKNKSDIISQQSSFVLTWDLNNPYQYIVAKLGEPFYVRISTDHKQIGRKYYVLNFGETQKWVDIETGLLIMSFGDILGTDFYPNTNIPKQEFRSASEYHYEFGKVTDEDVQMPDLSGYEVEEFDWKEIFEN